MKAIEPFLIALQFLTRLPVRLPGTPDERTIGNSLLYYPLVGVVIGVLLVALFLALADAPAGLRAALVLAAWVIVTGALHLDGLADSADAWAGGLGDREKTLAIMKDPYCGPAAVVTLVVVLLLKFAALHSLDADDWIALMLIPMVARAAVPLLFLTTPYVRANGLGSALAAHLPRNASIVVIAATGIVVLLVTGTRGLWLLAGAIGTFLLLRALMIRRLGGTTGDTAGALVELTEMVALLAVTLG
jgi:adenosylcobinamide-GDP ribazoletransferase